MLHFQYLPIVENFRQPDSNFTIPPQSKLKPNANFLKGHGLPTACDQQTTAVTSQQKRRRTERVREEKPKLFGNISTGKRKFKSTFFPTVVVFFTSFLLLLLLYP